ncbi:MAG: hypothetical protein SWO11_17215 [Thermodesulfobacteriota bacterium]|nr:hypothetical protein [Thermodesulfobacteriota bacterium]
MLLNPFSITMLSLALISSILALYGGFWTFRVVGNLRRPMTSHTSHNALEKRINPLLWFASVVLAVRLFTYPLFYGALQSFVKDIDGAMCIYGVTQVSPHLYRFLEIIKPLVFFSIGGWLLLHCLTRKCPTRSLLSRKLSFLLWVTIGILVDSMGDLFFFLSMNDNTPVTCCTPTIDSPYRISVILCRYLLGQSYTQPLLLIYYLSNLSLLGAAGYVIWKRGLEAKAAPRKRSLGLVFSMGFVNLLITGLALIEVIAPKLMSLPYHHCPFCLLQYAPDSFLIIGFFVVGTFGFGWAFVLEVITTDTETAGRLSVYLDKLYRLSFLCLGLSLVMVTFHILWGCL